MKKGWNIIAFSTIYLISFSLIYTIFFIGIDYLVWVLPLYTITNTYALIAILVLYAFERIKNKNISEYLYLFISMVITSYFIFDWKLNSKSGQGDYLYPIFDEKLSILILICVASHVLGYLGLILIKNLTNKHAS